ncbi:hypothetical protein A3I48_00845 [Candidatus Daviesbacteria bacterium RIFCSPLOWO2_02_FULL_36_7]|uniref:Uncharacterized protein n=1 Tax=Candidatus Daviesbacteria bacterium RIFCSPLOWO2_02_FULL_36_7 TaxID=1797792 RepID=A0A1F5MG59_9BACT|nr:MAG: hypothetical protein A3I48_00845 [Candidatus Daviesbacteria bacterium RIFCSPLOWO2_02_FULL_36_7]
MLEIFEPINVWVFFKNNLIAPQSFFWRGRQIKIDKVNLIHTSKNGACIFYHFSVSSGGNFYRLRFDSNKLSWLLEAVDEDSSAY